MRVIGEILKVKKNRYGHIDRGFLAGFLELEEVFDDVATFGMLFVKELGMELTP
jgi:hypothetical protein